MDDVTKEAPQLDNAIVLGELRRLVAGFVNDRDWQQFHNPKDLAAAIAVEASELQEIFLWRSPEDLAVLLLSGDTMDKVKAELADILILCCSLANHLEIDLSHTFVRKLAENELKYPVAAVRGRPDKYSTYPGRRRST